MPPIAPDTPTKHYNIGTSWPMSISRKSLGGDQQPSCRSDHLAKCQLQDWSLGSPSAWSGGEHEPYCEPGAVLAASFALLFFHSRTPRRRSPDLPKISLDCWSTVRHDDIVFILWRSHGCRRKSELATLRGDQRRSCSANMRYVKRHFCLLRFCSLRSLGLLPTRANFWPGPATPICPRYRHS